MHSDTLSSSAAIWQMKLTAINYNNYNLTSGCFFLCFQYCHIRSPITLFAHILAKVRFILNGNTNVHEWANPNAVVENFNSTLHTSQSCQWSHLKEIITVQENLNDHPSRMSTPQSAESEIANTIRIHPVGTMNMSGRGGWKKKNLNAVKLLTWLEN